MKAILVTFLAIIFTACSTTPTTDRQKNMISEPEVIAAQQAWCKALVDISSTYDKSGKQAANGLASKVIDEAYFYQDGPVLFKPTLTTNPQTFRTTREGALSYFVGGNPNFPDDKGFALGGWQKCEVDNAAINITGDSASTVGKVHFTNRNGEVTTVDKSWKFVKDNAGKLRIVVHHSSLEHKAK
ncbi:MAG: hypothetical protein ACN6NU_11340 [Acinetobacter sp.]